MKFIPKERPRFHIPFLSQPNATKEEAGYFSVLEGNLRSLDSYVSSFSDAISLFDFCEASLRASFQKNPPVNDDLIQIANISSAYSSWQFLAARDGAMSIYHFAKTMTGIQVTLKNCPSLHGQVDKSRFKMANKIFNAKFSSYIKIRNAVAHAGELSSTEQSRSRNAFRGSYESASISIKDASAFSIANGLEGRTYTTTYEGEILSYEVDHLSLMHLTAVASEICSAFITNQ